MAIPSISDSHSTAKSYLDKDPISVAKLQPLFYIAEFFKNKKSFFAEPVFRQAVYPMVWQDGEYKYFREKQLVKKAWDFG